MAKSAIVTSCAPAFTVPLQEVTAMRRASPCGNDFRLSMEVAAVSTRNRNFVFEMLTWITGRRSQVSSGISWADAALAMKKNGDKATAREKRRNRPLDTE